MTKQPKSEFTGIIPKAWMSNPAPDSWVSRGITALHPPDWFDLSADTAPAEGDLPFHLRPNLQFHEQQDMVHGRLLIHAELHFGAANRGPDREWRHDISMLHQAQIGINRERAEWMEWVKVEAINHGKTMNRMLCEAIMSPQYGPALLAGHTAAHGRGQPIGHFRGCPIYDSPPDRYQGREIDFLTIDEASTFANADWNNVISTQDQIYRDIASAIGIPNGMMRTEQEVREVRATPPPAKPELVTIFPIPDYIPRTIQHGPFTAHLIDSNFKVWEEAETMRNCIWRLYRDKIKSGEHIAYHVESPANKHGLTLGMDACHEIRDMPIYPGHVTSVEVDLEPVRYGSSPAMDAIRSIDETNYRLAGEARYIKPPTVRKAVTTGYRLYQIIGKANSQPKEPEAAQDFARHVVGRINQVWKENNMVKS